MRTTGRRTTDIARAERLAGVTRAVSRPRNLADLDPTERAELVAVALAARRGCEAAALGPEDLTLALAAVDFWALALDLAGPGLRAASAAGTAKAPISATAHSVRNQFAHRGLKQKIEDIWNPESRRARWGGPESI